MGKRRKKKIRTRFSQITVNLNLILEPPDEGDVADEWAYIDWFDCPPEYERRAAGVLCLASVSAAAIIDLGVKPEFARVSIDDAGFLAIQLRGEWPRRSDGCMAGFLKEDEDELPFDETGVVEDLENRLIVDIMPTSMLPFDSSMPRIPEREFVAFAKPVFSMGIAHARPPNEQFTHISIVDNGAFDWVDEALMSRMRGVNLAN